MSGILRAYFFSIDKVSINSKIMTLTLIFNFLLLYIVNKFFSFDIIVLFFLVSNLFLFILSVLYFIRLSKVKIEDLLFKISDFKEMLNLITKYFFSKNIFIKLKYFNRYKFKN